MLSNLLILQCVLLGATETHVHVVDDDGLPVVRATVMVRLPDGTTSRHFTDDEGALTPQLSFDEDGIWDSSARRMSRSAELNVTATDYANKRKVVEWKNAGELGRGFVVVLSSKDGGSVVHERLAPQRALAETQSFRPSAGPSTNSYLSPETPLAQGSATSAGFSAAPATSFYAPGHSTVQAAPHLSTPVVAYRPVVNQNVVPNYQLNRAAAFGIFAPLFRFAGATAPPRNQIVAPVTSFPTTTFYAPPAVTVPVLVGPPVATGATTWYGPQILVPTGSP